MKKSLFHFIYIIVIIALALALIMKKIPEKSEKPQEKCVSQKTSEKAETTSEKADCKIIEVPEICQFPELPTGCEATAAAMLLQYYGFNISHTEFARKYLVCNFSFYTSGGKTYGPDPNRVFAGDPFTNNSYGCFADAVTKALNKIAGVAAFTIKNKSLEELCREYIEKNEPVIIWATMGMKPPAAGNSWYLQNGSVFTWTAGEHCLVLAGYSEDYYYFCDPMSGTKVAYKKEISQTRFAELGSQAIGITAG